MSAVDQTRTKVRRIYTQKLGSVQVGIHDEFIIKHGSAVLFVTVSEGFGEKGTFVKLLIPLITDVPITDELFRFVATEGQGYMIGTLRANVNDDQKTAWMSLGHCLIGNDLDESELINATGALVTTADDLDDKLRERFGGNLYGIE
jgi:hypothetical protein